ncbi:hypothetical protein FS837_012393 [Tulasnella sp. UAMH 9824]|nr:hypothetical protein FS837_012393 [Tulasnella sp. UAMH 9824]
MFNRQLTQYRVGEIKEGSALWKLIHAVLNASDDRGLTTREVVKDIRRHFPKQQFTQANVSYSLSHSQDFEQVGFGGKGLRRWILTGKSDGVKRRNGMTARHSPTTFDRKVTRLTLGVVDSEHCRFATWKGCHAVINASPEGCLTTREVEEALRLRYPDRVIKRSTVRYNLTESEDFKQVYLEGKTPGRWFLTGKVKGINRTNRNRVMEPQTSTAVFSPGDDDRDYDDSDDDDDIATPPDTPPAAGLPYPSKTEEIEAQYSPDPTFSSPTLSSYLPPYTSTTIMIATLPRPGGGVHYPRPINSCEAPAIENSGMYKSPHFDSELETPHAQETASTTYPSNYTIEQVFAGLDTLSGLLEPSLPQHSVPKDPLSPSSFFPNLTRGNVLLRNPDNVELYQSTISYLGDLDLETSNHIGSFGGGTASTSFPQGHFTQEHRSGGFLGGWTTECNTLRPVYSTAVTSQQRVPNAHHLPAYPATYMKPNAVCGGSYDCSEVFGAWNAPGQTQANAVVTRSGLPFVETYTYLVS